MCFTCMCFLGLSYGQFFLAHLYEKMDCLCDAPSVRAGDQNVQFLRLGQFLSNYMG